MAQLVALDLPGGPEFVERLRAIWDAGDAALPVDQRLPAVQRRRLEEELGVGAEVAPGDALVVATSGTTGAPKGVVLTHDAIAASARATSARLEVSAADHWLACLPLSHVGGLAVVTRALITGTRLTVVAGADPTAIDASTATLISLVPTVLGRIDPTRWRIIVLGGGRPPASRPANTVATYGMTETASGIVYDGVPLAGVDVRIDAAGEIRVRGPMLLRCYRDGHDPKDTDGWFPTGDLGRWNSDGTLHVHGRRGDMIVTGGENVWPEPVERLLASHPDVADVVVFARPDAEWGQRVVARVVPVEPFRPPTLDDLRAFVKSQMPAYAAPRQLELTAQIERTALGKPIRPRS